MLTAQRILDQMREYGSSPPSPHDARMEIGREAARSVVVAYDDLLRALHTVDSMLTAGASPGTLHTIVEEALAGCPPPESSR